MTRTMLLVVLLTAVMGCNKQEPTPAVAGEAAVDPHEAFSELMTQARAYYNEGDTDNAAALLTEGLADPQFADNQPTIFRSLLDVLLRENRVVDAQTNFIAMLHASPETAAQAFGMISNHLRAQNDPSAYLAWTEQMVTTVELPESAVETAYAYYVDANVQSGLEERLAALADESVKRFGPAGTVRIFTRPLFSLVDQERYDTVQDLLNVLTGTGDPVATDFVSAIEMTMAAAQEQWDSATTMFTNKASVLSENAVRLALRTLSQRAMKANRSDVVDTLCQYLIRTRSEDQEIAGQAVSLYLNVALQAKDYDALITRLNYLKANGLFDLAEAKVASVFYDVISQVSPQSKQALLDMLWEEAQQADGANLKQLQALVIDGAMLTDNYRLALKVLDAGFRAEDTQWVTMARNKLAAHLALSEGHVDEAVARFRDFMETVKQWDSATSDPSTGLTYTREMTLGFNAKRIANIYRDAGRSDEAAAAYTEARDYFDQALQSDKIGEKEIAYIRQQMLELPSQEPVTP